MPRDYFQQRRARRRLTNVVLVGTLSLAFGWVLTRQPETPAFPIRASNQSTSLSGRGSQTTTASSGSSQIPAGPYALQELVDAAVHDDARGSDIQDNESSLVSEGSSNPADSTQNVLGSGATATQIHAGTLAFWDAYLKHDLAAKRYLQSDALVKMSRGSLTLERR
jgi:hypothetical protein